jgi:hypothetical protein
LRLLLIIINCLHLTTDNRNSLIIDLSDNYRYLSPKKISRSILKTQYCIMIKIYLPTTIYERIYNCRYNFDMMIFFKDFHDMDPEPRHISEFDCTVNAVNFYMLITVDDSPSKFNPTTRRKIIGYKFYGK